MAGLVPAIHGFLPSATMARIHQPVVPHNVILRLDRRIGREEHNLEG
jgi:hypothetical protein